jgi:3'-phosphoadenosine 5'-phosphosulfate sulfotransferase (PAPS reductase)/FAD synthetase
MASDALESAVSEHRPSHVFALFSGGHDSLCSTAVAAKHPAFSAAVHINTGIGIPETREFVRTTCRAQGWPLIEMHPDSKTYRDLVIEKGMPAGPKAHNTTYYWLKQRQVRRLVSEHKTGPKDRIALVTGIRTAESVRRMSAVMSVPVHRIGAQVWVNPILEWSKSACHRFMEAEGLERNPVVDLLHRSGECLCGALARRTEFEEIRTWYPDVAREIEGYENLAEQQGHIEDRWAVRHRNVSRQQLRFDHPLCVACEQ